MFKMSSRWCSLLSLSHLLLFSSLFSVGVLSSPYPLVHHVLHEKRHTPPPQWLRRQRLAKEKVIPVRIGLNQRNLELAEEYMYDVSHPRSSKYGQHWTPKKVAETFAPRYDILHPYWDLLHGQSYYALGDSWVYTDVYAIVNDCQNRHDLVNTRREILLTSCAAPRMYWK